MTESRAKRWRLRSGTRFKAEMVNVWRAELNEKEAMMKIEWFIQIDRDMVEQKLFV